MYDETTGQTCGSVTTAQYIQSSLSDSERLRVSTTASWERYDNDAARELAGLNWNWMVDEWSDAEQFYSDIRWDHKEEM